VILTNDIHPTYHLACDIYETECREIPKRIEKEDIIAGIDFFKKYIVQNTTYPSIYLSATGRSLDTALQGTMAGTELINRYSTINTPHTYTTPGNSDCAICITASGETTDVTEYLKNTGIPTLLITGNTESTAWQIAQQKDNILIIHNPSQSKKSAITDDDNNTIKSMGTISEQDTYRLIVSMFNAASQREKNPYQSYKSTINLFAENISELNNITPEPLSNLIDVYSSNKNITLGAKKGSYHIAHAFSVRLKQAGFNISITTDENYNSIFSPYTVSGKKFKKSMTNPNTYPIISSCAQESPHNKNENTILIPWQITEMQTDTPESIWAKILTWNNMIVFNDAFGASVFTDRNITQETLKGNHKKDFTNN